MKLRDHDPFKGEVQSIQKKQVKNLNESIGLWFGRFEMESEHLEAQDLLHQIQEDLWATDSFYDDYEVSEKSLELFPDKYKKWLYKDPLFGDYRMRKPNAISIQIDYIKGDSVYGKSVCAGNERPVRGIAKADTGNLIRIILNEPGDHPYDGSFSLLLNMDSTDLSGSWTPYNTQMESKRVQLKGIEFNYAPEGEEWDFDRYVFDKNISTVALTEADVEEQSRQRLRLVRNLIYARHGYSFRKKDVRNFFEGYDWYVPLSTDVRNELTEIEKQNIALMKRYEDYAEDYYDNFGR